MFASKLLITLVLSFFGMVFAFDNFDDTSLNNTSMDDHVPNNEASDMLEEDARERKQIELNYRKRQRKGAELANKVIHDGVDDSCSWKTHFVEKVKGELCGAHYKVLGLSRKRSLIDKPEIKRAYRSKTLGIHPDKNPSPLAAEAFETVQAAYECLTDDSCSNIYNSELDQTEKEISRFRQKKLQKGITVLAQGYHVSVLAALRVYEIGAYVWNGAGQWEISIPIKLLIDKSSLLSFLWNEVNADADDFGDNQYPIILVPMGKIVLFSSLLLQGSILLKIHSMAFLWLRLNNWLQSRYSDEYTHSAAGSSVHDDNLSFNT